MLFYNTHNWVFLNWLSLNSANSLNHDKIQDQYGYQRHSTEISNNRYLTWFSGKKIFPLLSLGWYLFRLVSGNRYLTRSSNENTLYITSTGNVSVARWVIPLVTIPLLDFIMIHWIPEFSEIHLGKTLKWQKRLVSYTIFLWFCLLINRSMNTWFSPLEPMYM